MDGLVDGRRAIVTGGGRGIGRAICLELARHGADVCVADINADTAASVADEVRALGRRSVSVAGDIGVAAGRQPSSPPPTISARSISSSTTPASSRSSIRSS